MRTVSNAAAQVALRDAGGVPVFSSFDVGSIESIKGITEEYRKNLSDFEAELQKQDGDIECRALLTRLEKLDDNLDFSWGLVTVRFPFSVSNLILRCRT
jgi:hypothetical protein